MPLTDHIIFLLRHLGPQRTRELADSLGAPLVDIDAELAAMRRAGRIERQAPDRWRLVPAAAVPTGNPGTR